MGTAQSLASAQTLLLFCGACIKILMPTGLLFEGGAMLSYSVAMLAQRWSLVGWFGVAAGIAMLIGPLLLSGLGPHILVAPLPGGLSTGLPSGRFPIDTATKRPMLHLQPWAWLFCHNPADRGNLQRLKVFNNWLHLCRS